VKKNRRGLGRGLGALIQSTVPEDDLRESDDSSDATANEKHLSALSAVDNQPPAVEAPDAHILMDHDTSGRNEGRSAGKVADSETALSPGDAAGTGEGPKDSIADRYLSKDAPADPQQPGAREARRPVDVFFPDRRAEPSSAAGEKKQPAVRTAASGNGRKRPAMPSLEPRTARSTRGNEQDAPTTEVHQSEEVEELLEQSASPEAQDQQTDLPGQTRVSGTAGTAELRSIAVADIHPNPRQPREVFDEDDMDELVASIQEVGVLQPIVVRPVDGSSPYELVMGERRWRASQRAGMERIPAIVRHTADTALLRDALLENLHRSQLNPLEEAAAYEQLLDDFECTQDELSSRIGRSRPQISNTLRLLKLPPLVQRRVASGVLSAGHARALLGLVDPGEMEKLAQKIVSEGLSVRATEELVSLHEGVRQAKSKPRAPRTERHERLDYLANSLTDQLDTTVKITLGARKGKIAIDFASVEDLNRIMTLINPSGSNAMKD
jgi:ParB family chromosome partitioning protein